jgi:hypothetical protein
VTCDVHRSVPPVTLIHVSLNEAEPIVIERAYLDVPVFGLGEGTALMRREGSRG